MTFASEAAKAFDHQFALTTPNNFPSIYSAGARTNMATQLSISSNFGLLGPLAACDTETALAPLSFKGRKYVRLIQFWSESYSFYFDLKTFNEADWQELKENMEQRDLTLIFQNANFDLRVLQGCRIYPRKLVHDTMLQSYLLTNGLPLKKGEKGHNNLAAIASRELGVEVDKTLQSQNWMEAELSEADMRYAMGDVQLTWEAYHRMAPKISEQGLDTVYEIERKALLPTVEMEATGLRMDRDIIDEQVKDLMEERDSSLAAFIEMLDTELPEDAKLPRLEDGSINLNKKTSGSVRLGTKVFAGFNPGSSQQLLKNLKLIGIEPVDPTGKPSVDKKYMRVWGHSPVVQNYLAWKRCDKHLQMCQTLIKHQDPETRRIHARFNQTGTFTGRYSSSSPNLQNIPRGLMRYAFRVTEGRALVDLDYGGMELRAACSDRIADEPAMRGVFNMGGDVHRATAAKMFSVSEDEVTDEQRRQAKATNFGALFGSSPNGLVNYFQSQGVTISLKEGTEFLNSWLAAYPNIARWHRHCRSMVEQGAPVEMVDGRRRYLYGDKERHTTFANNTVQGSCASVMKLAMYGIHAQLKDIDPSARLVAQIHDELLIEVAEDKADAVLSLAESVMVSAGKEIFGDGIEMVAEGGIGDSWGAAK